MDKSMKSWQAEAYVIESKEQPQDSSPTLSPYSGVVIGFIAGIASDGTPVVTWEGVENQQNYPALTQVAISAQQIGQRCTLVFEQGMLNKPVILGLLHNNETTNMGYQIIQAEDALILQCGASRIELHENGRINIQGLHIDNQAYGPYRIKGASVKVN